MQFLNFFNASSNVPLIISADSEITAMRSCGVSIMQIVSPILILTFGLTVLCLYLQVEVGPPLLGESRSMIKKAAMARGMLISRLR